MMLVLNNKSSFSFDEFNNYINKLSEIKNKSSIILCPSLCYIPLCLNLGIPIGSQDVSSSLSSFYTGEVTARQLKSLGVSYSIVGHGDRCESVDVVKSKLRVLLDNDIIPILCIGEQKENSELNEIKKELLDRISVSLEDLTYQEKEKIMFAYEPIWAINGNTKLDISNTLEVIMYIKELFPNNKVLYGGGVNIDNYYSLSNFSKLDGLLLGRMGNDIDIISNIIE